MDNGFTGIDIENALLHRYSFIDSYRGALTSLLKCFNYLFDGLYWIWCSPNAVTFSQKYNVSAVNIYVDTLEKFDILCNNLLRACNLIATANGYSQIVDQEHPAFVYDGAVRGEALFKNLVASHPTNGASGMNVIQVKLTLSQFDNLKEKALNCFADIPTNVAIYDPDGAQAQTIADTINETKSQLESIFLSITADIKSYIETEQNNIKLAKTNVVQTMNGGNTTNA